MTISNRPVINVILTEENSNRVLALSDIQICCPEIEALNQLDTYSIRKAKNYLAEKYPSIEFDGRNGLAEYIHDIVAEKYETAFHSQLRNIVILTKNIAEDIYTLLSLPAPKATVEFGEALTAEVLLMSCIGDEILDAEGVRKWLLEGGVELFEVYYEKYFNEDDSEEIQCLGDIIDQRNYDKLDNLGKPMYDYNHHLKFVVAQWWLDKGVTRFNQWLKKPKEYNLETQFPW